MKKPDEIIIQKFINNQCDAVEYNLMMDYLNSLSEAELSSFLDAHINLIDKMNPISEITSDFERKIDKMLSREKRVLKKKWRRIYSVAASIVFFMLIGSSVLYYFKSQKKDDIKTIWNENITEMGQKFSLTLTDGTNIVLNGGGKIKYPQNFNSDRREIYLEGEAFFEVAHDSSRPFIVRTGGISTQVLGTKFNVAAYSGDEIITISLVEGKVKVTNEKPDILKGGIILEPNQQLLFDLNYEESKINDFDTQKITGWKDNILIFEKETIEKVFSVLQRAYGVKFEISDKASSIIKITANFNKASLWTVIETIKRLTDLQYKVEKDKGKTKKVIYYKKTTVNK